jgi:hypothetical protein
LINLLSSNTNTVSHLAVIMNPQQTRSPELGSRIVRDGYPGLATWIARDPDYETFVFRRFDRLSARNLLNMQSQLVLIEGRLNELDEESRADRDVGLRRWERFVENVKDGQSPRDEERKGLNDELQRLMKEYRENIPCLQDTVLTGQQKRPCYGSPESRTCSVLASEFSPASATGSMAATRPTGLPRSPY